MIAANIISSTVSEAIVVDTTGRFYVLKLHQVFIHHLRKAEPDAVDLPKKAEQLLNKVKIIRAFDFTGLVEAVVEINHMLGTSSKSQIRIEKKPRLIVPDSEDEEEDEMLLDPTLPIPQKATSTSSAVPLLIIDDLLIPTGSLASVILYSFLQSLSIMTLDHNMVTVLIDSGIAGRSRLESGKSKASTLPNGAYFSHFLGTHILLSLQNRGNIGAPLNTLTILESRPSGQRGRKYEFSISDGTNLDIDRSLKT
jgi:hypothetical protein